MKRSGSSTRGPWYSCSATRANLAKITRFKKRHGRLLADQLDRCLEGVRSLGAAVTRLAQLSGVCTQESGNAMQPNRLDFFRVLRRAKRDTSLTFSLEPLTYKTRNSLFRSDRSEAFAFSSFCQTAAATGLSLMALMVQCFMSEAGYASNSLPNPPAVLHHSIPQIRSCRQLIIVTTESWNDLRASVQFLERAQAGETPWRKVGEAFPGVIGKQGFGWGIGLHGTGEKGAPTKKEGDQKSPAGVFKLYSVFGTASRAQVSFLRFPYEQVDPSMEAIDDPRSRYYNRIVSRAAVKYRDWSTSESMLAVGGRYRFGVMLEHNWSQIPGFGSCIFFHVWDRDRSGTAGCTAVSLAKLERLIHWLDADKHPLIVQLPRAEYLRLKQSWGLP